MIYGYEEPVAMPTMGVYDTSLMKAYIAGVKELYDKSQEEFKDYMKQYSDFYSGLGNDNQAYYDETVGRALDLMKAFEEKGIDPFKSPEARNMIKRLIWTTNTANINKMKKSAENYNLFMQDVQKKRSEGTLDEDAYNDLIADLNNWDSSKQGIMNMTSAPLYTSDYDIADKYLKDMDFTYDSSMRQTQNGIIMDFETVSKERLILAIKDNFNDILKNQSAKSRFNKFVRQIAALKPNASTEEIIQSALDKYSKLLANTHSADVKQKMSMHNIPKATGSGNGNGSGKGGPNDVGYYQTAFDSALSNLGLDYSSKSEDVYSRQNEVVRDLNDCGNIIHTLSNYGTLPEIMKGLGRSEGDTYFKILGGQSNRLVSYKSVADRITGRNTKSKYGEEYVKEAKSSANQATKMVLFVPSDQILHAVIKNNKGEYIMKTYLVGSVRISGIKTENGNEISNTALIYRNNAPMLYDLKQDRKYSDEHQLWILTGSGTLGFKPQNVSASSRYANKTGKV